MGGVDAAAAAAAAIVQEDEEKIEEKQQSALCWYRWEQESEKSSIKVENSVFQCWGRDEK